MSFITTIYHFLPHCW